MYGELILVSDESIYEFFLTPQGLEFNKNFGRFIEEFFDNFSFIIDKIYLPPKVYRKIYSTLNEGENGYKSQQQIFFETIFEEFKSISSSENYDVGKDLNDISQYIKDDIEFSQEEDKKVLVVTTKNYDEYPHFMDLKDFYKYLIAEYTDYELYIKNKFYPEPNIPN